jgi:5-formyltetrahydrofolate cyclo-ligase
LAYRRLRESRAARFPFPVEGRIPNFRGAEKAAARLRELELYRRARALKVNPDAPQLPVRAMALADGKTVYVPTPRLRGRFLRLDPADVPAGRRREAASLSAWGRYGRDVTPQELAEAGVDLVVTGCVAVAPDGARAGKGEGYGDLEYAMLRELGHPEVPVATTVHPAQIVPALAVEPHDIPVDVIVTPEGVLFTHSPYPKPDRVDWDRLTPEDLEAMPVLAALPGSWRLGRVPDVLAPGLAVVFVGLNPGRLSGRSGHHFAGPGNHFWRLLHEAGLTPRRLAPEEDGQLLRFGLGVTNLVARPSRGEEDLAWAELAAGGEALRERIARVRPSVVALLGKQVYRAYAGLSRAADVAWGWQDRQTVPGVREYLAANPSSRSTVPYAARLAQFREIREAVALRGPRVR